MSGDMGGTCGTFDGGKNAYMGLVRKPRGNSIVARPRYSWKYNILKM
jgi:hypothetical protein